MKQPLLKQKKKVLFFIFLREERSVPKPAPARALHGNGARRHCLLELGERAKGLFNLCQKFACARPTHKKKMQRKEKRKG